MKQTELAGLVKISDAFMSEIARGIKRPSWSTAKKLAKATSTNPILWLEGTPEQIREALNDSVGTSQTESRHANAGIV